MKHLNWLTAASSFILLSACLGHTITEKSDDGRFLAAIEAVGCSFDPADPPIVDFRNHYDLNPGTKRTPENDQLFARSRTFYLIEQGHLREETGPDGRTRIRSVYGNCA